MTSSDILVKRVIPGYSLVRATLGHPEWPKGYYGLVRCNDPDFIWKGTPLKEPFFNMSDEEINNLSDNDPLIEKQNQFYKRAESIEKQFVRRWYIETPDPMTYYYLVKACKQAGYSESKHGTRVMYWLVHHMATKLGERK